MGSRSGKLTPIVHDTVDSHVPFSAQWLKRVQFYRNQG
jgi:hypothetical protein